MWLRAVTTPRLLRAWAIKAWAIPACTAAVRSAAGRRATARAAAAAAAALAAGGVKVVVGPLSVVRCPLSVAKNNGQRTTDQQDWPFAHLDPILGGWSAYPLAGTWWVRVVRADAWAAGIRIVTTRRAPLPATSAFTPGNHMSALFHSAPVPRAIPCCQPSPV